MKQQRPDACQGCDRPFRPNRAPVANHPGTVMHAGRGLCHVCHLREQGREPSPCPGGCGRLLRPYRTKLDDFPGTLSRSGKGGRCKMCRPKDADAGPTITEQDRTRYITRELVAYMRWRGRDVSQLGISA